MAKPPTKIDTETTATTGKKATTKKAPVKKATVEKAAAKPKAATAQTAVTKKTARRKTAATRHISAGDRRQMIAEAAYLQGETQGFRSDEQSDWLQAEVDVDALLNKAKIAVRD